MTVVRNGVCGTKHQDCACAKQGAAAFCVYLRLCRGLGRFHSRATATASCTQQSCLCSSNAMLREQSHTVSRSSNTRQVRFRSSRLVTRVSSTGPLCSEAAAVSRYKTSNSTGLEPCLRLLKQAATDKSVQPELVEGALAYLEQNHAQPAVDINGSWRLVFSTATSSRLMQYIPVQEDFVIQSEPQVCALESVVGPFKFKIRGQITGWDASIGAMDFQFTTVDILLFNKQVWQVTPQTRPKTYTFYYEGEGIAAARSSAGGLALLRK